MKKYTFTFEIIAENREEAIEMLEFNIDMYDGNPEDKYALNLTETELTKEELEDQT